MGRYKKDDLGNPLPTYTGGSGDAGNRGDVILAPVSIDDVKVVITGASSDLGTLCTGGSGTIKWIYDNNYYITTSIDPQIGDACANNIPGGYTVTVKSITNGIPTFNLMNSDITPNTTYFWNSSTTIPICFLYSNINKYSIKKPLWDLKDIKYPDNGINFVDELSEHKKHNCGLYIKPIPISQFSKFKSLSEANSSTNFNFEYILFPRRFAHSVFRLTDFENYNHAKTFPTFSLLSGSQRDITVTRVYNADTSSYESYPPSNESLLIPVDIPLRCSDTSLLSAIEYPFAFDTNDNYRRTSYQIKSAVIVYDSTKENQSTLQNSEVNVYYGDLIQSGTESGSINFSISTTTNEIFGTDTTSPKTFKWRAAIGVDTNTQFSASNYVIPVKGFNISGSIYGTTITKSTNLVGCGVIYYKNGATTLTNSYTKKYFTVNGLKYYTADAQINYEESVFLENGAYVGYLAQSGDVIYSSSLNEQLNNIGSSTSQSGSMSIPNKTMSGIFALRRTNYTNASGYTAYLKVQIREKDSSNNVRNLGNEKIYKIQLNTNSEIGYFGIKLSSSTSNQSTVVFTGCTITDLNTSTVGFTNAPTYDYSTGKYFKEAYLTSIRDGSALHGYKFYLYYQVTFTTLSGSPNFNASTWKNEELNFSTEYMPSMRINP